MESPHKNSKPDMCVWAIGCVMTGLLRRTHAGTEAGFARGLNEACITSVWFVVVGFFSNDHECAQISIAAVMWSANSTDANH